MSSAHRENAWAQVRHGAGFADPQSVALDGRGAAPTNAGWFRHQIVITVRLPTPRFQRPSISAVGPVEMGAGVACRRGELPAIRELHAAGGTGYGRTTP